MFFLQCFKEILPFEGNDETDVAPGDNECDSPALSIPAHTARGQRAHRGAGQATPGKPLPGERQPGR